MSSLAEIAASEQDLREWRRHLHAHPELGFEETETAAFVARKLEEFGLDEVHTGIAKTGVVGVLRAGTGNRAIGLRADMDALPIKEMTGAAHASKVDGKMHACGHDGHTTMLLGAARHLAGTRDFDGTLYFIFQPAEEGRGGGRVMIKERLFERFPVERVYGLHNWPSLELGSFAICKGPCMAATAEFSITLTGKGCHAAMPHLGRDPVTAAAQLVLALQTVVSRETDPVDQAVLSVTRLRGGDATNVIADEVTMAGTVRTFKDATQERIGRRLEEIANGIATAFGMAAQVRFTKGYPATFNHDEESEIAIDVAGRVVGREHASIVDEPVMGAEDFAYMLNERPGSYIWMGTSESLDEHGRSQTPGLHSAHFDFNDAALKYGVAYWVELARHELPSRT